MSSVRVAYYWPDGSHMDAQCWADDTYYVEAIAVARVTAVEGLIEAIEGLEDDIAAEHAAELAQDLDEPDE